MVQQTGRQKSSRLPTRLLAGSIHLISSVLIILPFQAGANTYAILPAYRWIPTCRRCRSCCLADELA